MPSDAYEVTLEVRRGTDTDDRDKVRAKVGAASIDQLDERVEELREKMEAWADDLRTIEPVRERHDDGQASLSEAAADD